jgi:hypothetical protein
MAILDALFGKKDSTDVTVEPTVTIETVVTPAGDISLATAITGETEAVIYSTEK